MSSSNITNIFLIARVAAINYNPGPNHTSCLGIDIRITTNFLIILDKLDLA